MVGQNRMYTLCMTAYLVISPATNTYIYRMYMVLANPAHAFSHELAAARCSRWGSGWVQPK